MANGQVRNHSSKELWVVETDTGPAIAHKLAPGRQSKAAVDADGFKAVDGTLVDGHNSWVKIVNFSTADVANQGAQLTRGCFLCSNVGDNEFGNVTYDQSAGWGEPISGFLDTPSKHDSNKCASDVPTGPGAIQVVRLDGGSYVVAKLSANLPEGIKHNIEVTVREVPIPGAAFGCVINCNCNGKVSCGIL